MDPIDRFILANLEKNGLEPAPPADKNAAAAPRDLRSDWPSAYRKGNRRFSCRSIAEGFRESGGSAARFAALWRTMGPALAGCDALCRFHRQR